MKKKSSRRRTKIVRRSKKNLRRTIKRKNIRKSGRRPTRRYSRIQRGGEPDTYARANNLYNEAMLAKQKNKKDFRTNLRKAAKAGDKNANYELGKIYEEESKKYKKAPVMEIQFINSAIKKYAIAAIQEHFDAKLALQRMFNEENVLVDKIIKKTDFDTFLAFKTLQNAALAAVALSVCAHKFDKYTAEVDALRHEEEEVMRKFREFAKIFITDMTIGLNIGKEALDEVERFKEKLEKFVGDGAGADAD